VDTILSSPKPVNEPVLSYAPGTPERAAIESELRQQTNSTVDIPLVIGASEYRTSSAVRVVAPDEHARTLARVHQAEEAHVQLAIAAACAAAGDWARMPFADRAAIFLKAADIIAGPWRAKINAATMLGQGKTVQQAEIDAACELVDFLRFNVEYARSIYQVQPHSAAGTWNQMDYRPLEGFVYAVTPFNFTAIGGNLATAPALMGNCVIWKPAATASLSNYYVMQALREAGLPPGVINFVPGNSGLISERLLYEPGLAGIHFTGSTPVFNSLWQQVASNLKQYRGYPRLVGETGGKDFVLAHVSADVQALAVALVRGAFEYQGQKCSAASRAYIPRSTWAKLKPLLVEMTMQLRMGPVSDLTNFMSAVIDAKAYERIHGYLVEAHASGQAEVIAGGHADSRTGYFVQPTVVEVQDPQFLTMREEIFGPVLSVYVYEDKSWSDVLRLVDQTGPYALTGAVFASDRAAIVEARDALRFGAGNFYINDKPTGAVVGQQPFGGARGSGTNDKAGSHLNLLRWVSPRTIKETFLPQHAYEYPHMR
jgi:1-pyrroline-5-carboxylate dehydrogenase